MSVRRCPRRVLRELAYRMRTSTKARHARADHKSRLGDYTWMVLTAADTAPRTQSPSCALAKWEAE